MADASQPVELLVCTTCRAGQPTNVEGPRPGTQLFDALTAADLPENVTLKGVECFSNCDQGCSVTLRGGNERWTYVYGRFTGAEDAELVADGVTKYAATVDGLVPWRERSIHFRKNCIARIPPQETPE
ncbi:DUF1636 family protein [Shimia abyssi]|uniref:Putative metal-binding protein n=1 Tax=Shimia abyssi TaxID=1662395 RepID=A0A2P8FD86_9RHOB|nr:DUF1636 domain-containing protein [Shimia abyssi]PSL19679.1 putative metal-binding protein [Shimia abyssi]